MATLLRIEDLKVRFRLGREQGQLRWGRAVGDDTGGIGFDIPENTTVALVGESGSGKSVTAMSIVNLLPDNAERSGRILFDGRDLLQASTAELRALRGRAIACVFQDPMGSLNPVFTVGAQIAEPLRLHLGLSRRAALARAEELLAEVGLPEPKRRLSAYPHELSGGQQQRVMIAMALACEPRLLIADEPTTALDVTVQRQILELLAGLVAERGMALILISHDLGVIAQSVARTLVMYGGTVVESGPTRAVFGAMAHPYTQGLFAARPRLGTARVAGERLPTIAGSVPDLADLPAGCPFAGRCPRTLDACHAALPPAVALGAGHEARCIRLGEP